MKKALLLLTSVVLLMALPQAPVHAQFFKKLFGREEKKKPARKPGQKPPGSNKSAKTGTTSKKESEGLKLERSIKKSRYRIDVLAPVYLNELVANGKPVYKSHLPTKVLPGLSFYQGIKLAVDTLNSYGYHMDVYFHDIGDPSKSLDVLLKQGKLDSTDLIIGAVGGNQVAPLAALAKKHAINFVSAFSPSDGNVKGNLYFNLLQPTLHEHCDAIRNSLSLRDAYNNIIVYRRTTNALDEWCFREITRDSPFVYARALVNTPMAPEKLKNLLDSNLENVIVMPIVDVNYAGQLLNQLAKSFPKYRFEVYGMPSWKGMAVLERVGSLPNIGITIGAPFYFDATTSAGRGFSEHYSRVYGGKPAEMAYRGYETMYWYAYLLNRYGTVFNEHFQDNGVSPFTRFELKLGRDKNSAPLYYENTHIYMYRFQAGSFSVIQ